MGMGGGRQKRRGTSKRHKLSLNLLGYVQIKNAEYEIKNKKSAFLFIVQKLTNFYWSFPFHSH